jgi:predicted phosphodiesterase
MEPIAFISDIHGNLEALTAVLEDIKNHGIKRVAFLGDFVNYGPNSGEVIDHVMELLKPDSKRKIEVVKGLEAEIVLEGNHDRTLMTRAEGNSARYGMHDGPYEALVLVCEHLFTSDPQTYLSTENKDKILMKGKIDIHPRLSEVIEAMGERYGARIDRNMPGLATRVNAGSMGIWISSEFMRFMETEGVGMMAREKPPMPEADPEVEKELEKYDKAQARYEFVKWLSGRETHGIIKDLGIDCFHGSWNSKEPYQYVFDPYQLAVLQSASGIPSYSTAESAINMAKRLRKKEPLIIAHGHTHIPGIFKTKKDGVEIVVIDTGNAGVPRARDWVGFDYNAGRQIEEHDCHTKANYIIVDENGPRVKWVEYAYEDTYAKMKKFYDWDSRSVAEKKPMTFMKLWAKEHGEWIPEAA